MFSMGVSSTIVGNLSTPLIQLMSSGATGVGRHGADSGGVGGISVLDGAHGEEYGIQEHGTMENVRQIV